MCVRGLKLFGYSSFSLFLAVARRVRAWIETVYELQTRKKDWSHAVCVRGLKRLIRPKEGGFNVSHAVCVRGLKRAKIRKEMIDQIVARRVRAWIETHWIALFMKIFIVARRVRAWIETLLVEVINLYLKVSHAVCVRGLKLFVVYLNLNDASRTPCACVD